MISSIISRLVILVFGTLYPAYASYKAVRTKNVKEYVKWMMYWIVFALFTCAETFTDVFFSFWFPFYYEIKVILVLWLLSPATKGSSILYRKFVHPMLTKREQEIDEYISRAKEQGYHTVLTLGTKGVNYATSVIMQTAIKGGGGLVNQLRRSYSLSDISSDIDIIADMNRINKGHPDDQMDDTDAPIDPRLLRTRGYSTRSPAEMYFPEVDVEVRQRRPRSREPSVPLSQIRSTEDVSSGYSSAEPLYAGHPKTEESREALIRTSSVGSSRVARTKPTRTSVAVKRAQPTEDSISLDESEESDSQNQEDEFFDVSSETTSLTSQPTVIPALTSPISIPILPDCTNFASNKQSIDLLRETHNSTALKTLQIEPIPLCDEVSNTIHDKTDKDNGIINESIILPSISKPIASILNKDNIEPSRLVEMSRELSSDEVDEKSVAPTRMPVLILPSTNIVVRSLNTVNDVLDQSGEMQTVKSDDYMKKDCKSLKTYLPEIAPLLIIPNENIDVIIEKDIDEGEFFDTEEESITAVYNNSQLTKVDKSSDDCVSISNAETEEKEDLLTEAVQMPGDNTKKVLKDDRAGKYNKRPAPCPPKKIEVDLLRSNQNNEASCIGSETHSSSFTQELAVFSSSETSILDKTTPCQIIDIPKNACIDNNSEVLEASQDNVVPIIDDLKIDSNVPMDVTFGGSPNTTPTEMSKLQKSCEAGQNSKALYDTSTDKSVSKSPSSQKKKVKENSSFSRLLSMPKSQLSSMFPFWNHDSSRGLVATSLTSLSGDLEEQLRSSGSCSNIVLPSNTSKPPALPPRNPLLLESENASSKSDENSMPVKLRESSFRLREMSHSPPRRQSKLD